MLILLQWHTNCNHSNAHFYWKQLQRETHPLYIYYIIPRHTSFSFYAFLQCSPAERNSFSLTVRWGWTTSYQTVALNSEISDGLIKTHYLLCIFVMTFNDVLHCSGRLVISIKAYLNNLSTFISRSQKILITFFFCCTKRQWACTVFAHVLSFFRKTRWNKFFPVLVLWLF